MRDFLIVKGEVMNKLNRNKIMEMYPKETTSYVLHLKILTIVLIFIGMILCINIIKGLISKENIFDVYSNPILYYAIFILSITALKLWALYNFKKLGIYMVYIINGLIQITITIWFLIAVIVSFLANILITVLVVAIFIFISIVNISLILYYHRIRGMFIY